MPFSLFGANLIREAARAHIRFPSPGGVYSIHSNSAVIPRDEPQELITLIEIVPPKFGAGARFYAGYRMEYLVLRGQLSEDKEPHYQIETKLYRGNESLIISASSKEDLKKYKLMKALFKEVYLAFSYKILKECELKLLDDRPDKI